jgi:hypothetical protein
MAMKSGAGVYEDGLVFIYFYFSPSMRINETLSPQKTNPARPMPHCLQGRSIVLVPIPPALSGMQVMAKKAKVLGA